MKNFSSHTSSYHAQRKLRGTSQTGKEEEEEEDEDRARKDEWDFILSALISPSPPGPACDTLGVVEFDPSDTLLATGGIARKIRVYRLKSLLPSQHDERGCPAGVASLNSAAVCDYHICTPAKLSSLKWRPGTENRVIGSGDYDGVVTEYDLEKRIPIFERDEHGGRRVWSVDYGHLDPVLGASGSDDGTMQMWDPRCEGGNCVAKVHPGGTTTRSSVCCVEFDPFGGALVAVGCTDRKAYCYDVRRMVDPVLIFEGHHKAVSYVKFVDHRTIATSGTDGCLKMWRTEDCSLVRTYKGHVNARRFVGLSVWRKGGLFGCGSESNQVFVYDRRWSDPIWLHGFEPVTGGFVSSVCWKQGGEEDESILVAGGSDGVLQVFLCRARRKVHTP